MKKSGKRLVALLLVLVTVIGVCAIPGSAATSHRNYVALGDSVTMGCDLPSFKALGETKKSIHWAGER